MKKFVTLKGTVINYDENGCFVRLDETDEVVYYFGNGMKGDRVYVSAKRIGGRHSMVVCELESVIGYGDFEIAA